VSSEFLRVLPPGIPTADLAAAVADALAGGPPVAALPDDPVVADRVLTMLQPGVPVTEPDAAVVVSTSGSTGAPKGVVLSRAAITASATATEQRLGGPGRWLLALPTHYVAGLMVVARAVAAGRPVLDVGPDLAGLPAALRGGSGPNYLSVVTTQLTRALRDPDLSAALSRIDAVLLGGGPAEQELLDRARTAGITVITTYGMSETCGGCVYDGVPLPGVTVALEANPEPLEQGPELVEGRCPEPVEGRILLGGNVVFSGYRLQPELTSQTLINGMVRTNDRGVLDDDRLQVLGRYDDVIISGGLKIDIAAVERAARGWPDLGGGEIALVGVPDPDWGTRLIGYAEALSGDLDPVRLRTFLDGRVARHEVPSELVVLDALPRTSSGKVDREKLRRGVTNLNRPSTSSGHRPSTSSGHPSTGSGHRPSTSSGHRPSTGSGSEGALS
jgi:o-succinylbenzoate---CoA ligase